MLGRANGLGEALVRAGFPSRLHHRAEVGVGEDNDGEEFGFLAGTDELENFDAVGKWRTEDEGNAIDATGVITEGTSLDGIKSLRELTLRKGDLFAQGVTEKLLTYAMGRGVEYEDMPLIRSLTRNAANDNYRFSALVMGVIQSPAFTMNLKTTVATIKE